MIPVFIFDQNILDQLSDRSDARVTFIFKALEKLKSELRALHSELLVEYGKPEDVWQRLISKHQVHAVYTNRDYESYAIRRDQKVKSLLASKGIGFFDFKDHVLFEKEEVLKDNGEPYTVFTPYKNKMLLKLEQNKQNSNQPFGEYPVKDQLDQFFKSEQIPLIALEEMCFKKSSLNLPDESVDETLIKSYARQRDFPALDATTKLGIHLRFGTIGIRKLANVAFHLDPTFFSELLWRDFYSMILQAFPHVEFGSFKKAYDRITWDNNESHFEAWCKGETGYPMVDAGMRQLNETGFMHNRLRMIAASFLVKHLLIDWRWGEAYFAEKLLDFDLASNNGGWQWAAGCGTDAAPYFRIFNPEAQQKKFDPDGKFIQKWIPELDTYDYPKPIVEHTFARKRCLDVFKKALLK